MKTLFLADHISTGGMPQYLYMKVKEMVKDPSNDVWVIIYRDTAPIYNVQRNKLQDLIGNRLGVLNRDDNGVLESIKSINPDVVHLQEVPEIWMPDSLAEKIYYANRSFKIIETSHTSTFDVSTKRFFPDAFVFVTPLHLDQYAHLNIPSTIEEYPIEDNKRPNRKKALAKLGLDPNYIHILNVGLFTPGKNQGRIFKIANYLLKEKIQFHFVGNQAGNFENYWKPIMETKPANCTVWGERSDVENFYSAMDLFLFTSIWECSPIVVREALSWKMPIYMHNLSYYKGMYDKFDLITYIDDKTNVDIAKDLLSKFKLPIPEYLLNVVDTDDSKTITSYINPITTETKVHFSIKEAIKDVYVRLIETNSNLVMYTLHQDFLPNEYFVITYSKRESLGGVRIEITYKDGKILHRNTFDFGKKFNTIVERDKIELKTLDDAWGTYREIFIDKYYEYKNIKVKKDDVVVDIGANYGFFSLSALHNGAKKVYSIEPFPKAFECLTANLAKYDNSVIINVAIDKETGKSNFDVFNTFVQNQIAESSDIPEKSTGRIVVDSYNINELIQKYSIEHINYLKIDCEGGEYALFETIDDSYLANHVDKIIMELHYFGQFKNYDDTKIFNKLTSNGFKYIIEKENDTNSKVIAWKPKPRNIKLIHLLSSPDEQREINSIKSLSPLKDLGINYIQHINPRYTGDAPAHSSNNGSRRASHYGNYKAFRDAIEKEFTEDTDFLILCECDCILEVEPEYFMQLLERVCDSIDKEGISYFSFGDRINLADNERKNVNNHYLLSPVIGEIEGTEEYYITDKIIYNHCIMFPQDTRSFLLDQYANSEWDVADLFHQRIFYDSKKKMAIMTDRVAAQDMGMSIIDDVEKSYVTPAELKKISAIYTEQYKASKIVANTNKDRVSIVVNSHYVQGPYIQIVQGNEAEYNVKFGLTTSDEVVYSTKVQSKGGWAQTSRKYLQPWKIEIFNSNNKVVWSDKFDPTEKRIFINLDSRALGDTLAWFPAVQTFKEKYNAKVIVSTFWNKLLKSEYPDLEIIDPGGSVPNIYAQFSIGCIDNDYNVNKNNWRLIPLQQVATDILGLDYEEIRPKVKRSEKPSRIKGKYVCISDQSTMDCKLWNYPNAWQITVDHLRGLGYEVVVLGTKSTNLNRVISKIGCSIEETINYLQYSSMFVGLGSGLSWLSWALEIPVILISGFSEEWAEFYDCIRIINKDVCHGCYNDIEHRFGRNKEWCPRKKDFECSKMILPDTVITEINRVLVK